MALQVPVGLAPDETLECAFLLGEACDREAARALIRQYRSASAVENALAETRAFWDETLSGVQIQTPAPEIDIMVNGWLTYQNLCCRIWARSAFYQSGGAFGFRDQLQDTSALVYLLPELTRRQIQLHAAHQFVEGDVMHWWHPPTSRGIRTRFSDDLLWLPFVTAFYVGTTGDESILGEPARFITARALQHGEDEAYLLPQDSGESADIYEHCCRALDRSLTEGAHGLPLMGSGDWNDGMNRIGREGRGESVWLGFFIYDILGQFIPICERREDAKRVARYRAYRDHLVKVLNEAGWDGAWYRRAYYDDGTPLGSAQNSECRIDALAQAWAVIS
jgi:cyclic beta-1,2-glucan synthetase